MSAPPPPPPERKDVCRHRVLRSMTGLTAPFLRRTNMHRRILAIRMRTLCVTCEILTHALVSRLPTRRHPSSTFMLSTESMYIWWLHKPGRRLSISLHLRENTCTSESVTICTTCPGQLGYDSWIWSCSTCVLYLVMFRGDFEDCLMRLCVLFVCRGRVRIWDWWDSGLLGKFGNTE